MRKVFKYLFLFTPLLMFFSCKEDGNYPYYMTVNINDSASIAQVEALSTLRVPKDYKP